MIVSLVAAAPASAQTRSLKLHFIHTKERAEITYMRNGRYDQRGLDQINHLLRDWRRNEPGKIDPKLLDLLWHVYRDVGARDHIHVVSAYRSPATNAMLRSRSSGVAQNSQHTQGRAIDFFIPGVSLSRLRAAGFKAETGGVGYYPRSGSPFVHLDTGNVRSWPRMSRSELLALFPDGRTIHLPADGKPLPGYQQALAAYQQRQRSGGSIQIASADSDSRGSNSSSSGSGGGILATLLRGGSSGASSSAATATAATAPAQRPAAAAPAPAAPAAQPAQQTPGTILAALPPRDVPVPAAAPRPLVDVGAPARPLIADMPAAPAAAPAEIAAVVPIPTRRPDLAPAIAVAAVEQAGELKVSALVAEQPRSGGSEAIADTLAVNGAQALAAVRNPPLPTMRQPLAAEGAPLLASASVEPFGGAEAFASALPAVTDIAPAARSLAAAVRGDRPDTAAVVPPAERRLASLRTAAIERAPGSDVHAAIDAGVRTTGKSGRPMAGQARPDPRSVPLPVRHELMRWAFRSDVAVAAAARSARLSMGSEALRRPPRTVYNAAGFRQDAPHPDASRFAGNAVRFLSVARFVAN